MSSAQALFTTTCDWRIADLGWMYTLFFVLLGISAATWGGWLERAGPRKAGVVSAFCWCGGLLISALGVDLSPALDAVARIGRDRRHRLGARLHLAGVDADQMVPGPARHGDGHGDHGLRRRRDDRRAARQSPDELISAPRIPSACGRPSSPWPRSISCSCWAARSATACRPRAGSPEAGRRRRRSR